MHHGDAAAVSMLEVQPVVVLRLHIGHSADHALRRLPRRGDQQRRSPRNVAGDPGHGADGSAMPGSSGRGAGGIPRGRVRAELAWLRPGRSWRRRCSPRGSIGRREGRRFLGRRFFIQRCVRGVGAAWRSCCFAGCRSPTPSREGGSARAEAHESRRLRRRPAGRRRRLHSTLAGRRSSHSRHCQGHFRHCSTFVHRRSCCFAGCRVELVSEVCLRSVSEVCPERLS